MDANYKDSAIAQIEGNPTIDFDFKKDLIEILKHKSENAVKRLCKQGGNGDGRYFYESDETDLSEDLDSITNQAEINRLRRQGYEFKSDAINNKYPATYRKSGHYYVNGVRVY